MSKFRVLLQNLLRGAGVELKDLLKKKPSIAVRLLRVGILSSAIWGAYYNYIQQLPDQEFTEEETVQLSHIFKIALILM
tara:strand:+ start:83320 stop:83556 length:237 start_codon:yes stop_codon:yes gene_type:complete